MSWVSSAQMRYLDWDVPTPGRGNDDGDGDDVERTRVARVDPTSPWDDVATNGHLVALPPLKRAVPCPCPVYMRARCSRVHVQMRATAAAANSRAQRRYFQLTDPLDSQPCNRSEQKSSLDALEGRQT